MSYREALEAADARVLKFTTFGSWQGEWAALVEYKGKTGWVRGSFGSCSMCDAFRSEFGYDYHDDEDYEKRLADFGETYLDGLTTTEKLAAYFDEAAGWDVESEIAAKWIRETGDSYKVQ